ncbi:MAG: type 3 dihydrofolate reductase [Candidatus Niyogibacteria bacterium]|nr:MAG: type 3 dihydrofolate reductase [Candidatus Niyogibacteria bacterium]
MKISLIAAVSKNGVIGKTNSLPWHLPADLKRFKEVTMGKPIIMGRKTYASIGRPLPGRKNIILTSDENFTAEGCVIVHSKEDALKEVGDVEEAMVIGGGMTYEQFLPVASRIYLTEVDAGIEGDIYFPKFDRNEWREVFRERHEPDQKNQYSYSFVILEKV